MKKIRSYTVNMGDSGRSPFEFYTVKANHYIRVGGGIVEFQLGGRCIASFLNPSSVIEIPPPEARIMLHATLEGRLRKRDVWHLQTENFEDPISEFLEGTYHSKAKADRAMAILGKLIRK